MRKLSHWIKQPTPTALVLIGLVLALTKFLPPISLTHQVAFFLILPPILFQGGMHLNLKNLKQDWKPVILLAVTGVVISALIVGYPLAYFWHIPLNDALLFGALISPTDPVSVLAIMKKVKAPERLRTILEAESLFNDGTGVVLFMVILTMIQNDQPLKLDNALSQFLLVTGGGALIGGFCGYLIIQFMRMTTGLFPLVALSVALAFGAPLTAEALHCSGIIAVVVAGMMISAGKLSHMSPEKKMGLDTFWKVLDFIVNILIFLIIGLQLQVIGINNLIEFKGKILTAIIIVLISRAIVVYPTIWANNRIFRSSIPSGWDHVLFWGGLRGTIPIILMLQLPKFQYQPLFLSATFGVVLFSIIIQALTIKGLLKSLNLPTRQYR